MARIVFSDFREPAAAAAYDIALNYLLRSGAVRDEYETSIFLAQCLTAMVNDGQSNKMAMANVRSRPARSGRMAMALLTIKPTALDVAIADATARNTRPVPEEVASALTWDSFPSGHALHMGALASAAGALPPRSRATARLIAIGLSLTRIVTLAHWASDVASGFVMGVVMERILRLWTGYPFALRGALGFDSDRAGADTP